MISKKKKLKKNFLIIIPAKNEYYNLVKLLKILKKTNFDILIVDDNSIDKTSNLKKKK